ncbi:MAG TPA: bifunctional YncE family protein/alkaline phosphatase family protein [Longimicrobiales bacterium]
MSVTRAAAVVLALTTFACSRGGQPPEPAARGAADLAAEGRLPTGARLDPEGSLVDVGNFPLGMVLSPDGRYAVLVNSGWREQGVQVVDRAAGRASPTVRLPSAFLGVAISPDGGTVYASGGNQDVIYRLGFAGGTLTLQDSIMLAAQDTTPAANPVAPGEVRRARTTGRYYPAGLALSPDGRTLYVAENLRDRLAVVDLASRTVLQRFPTERYPYGVVVAPDGSVYVSAWGGRTVSIFRPVSEGKVQEGGRVEVGWHPSALLLSRDGARLFAADGAADRVAVVDTRRAQVLTYLGDPPPAGPSEGSTPNGLALSTDGARLFVAEADANAVALFDLSPGSAGPGAAAAAAGGDDRLLARIPAGWYPSGVAVRGDTLLVLNGKGRGAGPNAPRPQPGHAMSRTNEQYTLGQINGTLQTLVAAGHGASAPDAATLARWDARVVRANGWDRPGLLAKAAYPPIEHVVYIIRENRTYDQVLGDLKQADGDTALTFFPRAVTPNAHALAERFGIFDRFFTNAEVSADGHNWSTAAYASDYVEKTTPSNYSGRGRSYDYEGTNRDTAFAGIDDAAEPSMGYLWDAAGRAGITFRNYGEFVRRDGREDAPAVYRAVKPFLLTHTDPAFPGFDMDIPDQRRADEWIRELQAFERAGAMPALEIMRLPNDHTAGARVGELSPRAFVADNDLALGRIVEALSRTQFWKSSVIFVLEDDAQDGPDHVDSHRSPVLVISPWSRGGVSHRFANTTDVLATIADILGLHPLSRYQYYGRPLRDAFGATPDLRPYVALTPGIPLTEKNTAATPGARESERLSLGREDSNDDDFFNRILWKAIKGNRPYPGSTRAGVLEMRR